MRGKIPWKEWRDKALPLLRKYKFVLLVILAGVALLLWPAGEKKPEAQAPPAAATTQEEFDLDALEQELSETLSRVQGAGEVTVMLTIRGGTRRVLAHNETSSSTAQGDAQSQTEIVVVSEGSGAGEGPVLVQRLYPPFQGALVVCSGGGNAQVRLKLMEAVSALTGLGADKISICKGKG